MFPLPVSPADIPLYVQNGGQGQADPTPTLVLLALCFPYLCHLLTYSAKSLFGSRHWPSIRMTLAVSCVDHFSVHLVRNFPWGFMENGHETGVIKTICDVCHI